MTLLDLPTPALLVDLDVLDRNIAAAAAVARQYGVALRPHIKTHKCPAIAARQRNAGAIGLTVATIGEAEAMVEAGHDDIFIARPVIGIAALARLHALRARATIAVAVDHADQVSALAESQSACARTPTPGPRDRQPLRVRIEIDCGHHRCGMKPDEALVALGRHIAANPGLLLDGVFTHAGHAYAAATVPDIAAIGKTEGETAVAAARALRDAGLDCRTVSVGSTPTLPHCAAVVGVTEVRPGNYVFHDAIQLALGVAAIDNCALAVLTTVLAIYADRFVIDGGSKTFALDRGAHGLERAPGHGRIIGHPEWVVARLSEEHGVVTMPPGGTPPTIGTRLRVIPNHACAVVNLHSQLHLVRGGEIIAAWPVVGRY